MSFKSWDVVWRAFVALGLCAVAASAEAARRQPSVDRGVAEARAARRAAAVIIRTEVSARTAVRDALKARGVTRRDLARGSAIAAD